MPLMATIINTCRNCTPSNKHHYWPQPAYISNLPSLHLMLKTTLMALFSSRYENVSHRLIWRWHTNQGLRKTGWAPGLEQTLGPWLWRLWKRRSWKYVTITHLLSFQIEHSSLLLFSQSYSLRKHKRTIGNCLLFQRQSTKQSKPESN